MFSRKGIYIAGMSLLAALCLAGCGDDAKPPRDPASITDRTPYAPPRPSNHSFLTADAPVETGTDPLSSPNGLLGSADSPADTGAILPQPGDNNPPPAAPPDMGDDPLASAPDTLGGPTPGTKMPTEHSHWLTGNIFNARVAVRVNGLFLGTFSSPQDKDITMKLRPGINTLTLAYTPLASTASAHLDILESEHTPPIPPLATFRSPLSDSTSRTSSQTTTQTLTFLAR